MNTKKGGYCALGALGHCLGLSDQILDGLDYDEFQETLSHDFKLDIDMRVLTHIARVNDSDCTETAKSS